MLTITEFKIPAEGVCLLQRIGLKPCYLGSNLIASWHEHLSHEGLIFFLCMKDICKLTC